MVFSIVAAIIVLLLILIIYLYNRLIKHRNKMKEAWSIIDVFLKKRHELVPALVDTVKGYAKHEQGTLEEVAQTRSEALLHHNIDEVIHLENKLGRGMNKIFVIAERYPDLSASDNFLELQKQLSKLENDLEKVRRYYNGTVREYNTHLESFPSNIIAGLFHFKRGIFYNQG